jgi:hypothetical protein
MGQMMINRDFSSISPSAKWMFFKELGFVVDREARIKYSDMSSFKYLIKSITLRQFFKLLSTGKMQATWRLKAV